MSTDHIIIDTKSGEFKCELCGVEEQPPFMPAPINVIIDAMDVFIEQHKDCKPPAAETVMSEYIKGFDSGYDYVLQEIARYERDCPTSSRTIPALLAHLRMEKSNA